MNLFRYSRIENWPLYKVPMPLSFAFMTSEKLEKLQVFWASLGSPRDSRSKTNWLERNVPKAEHLQRKVLSINPACGSKELSTFLKLATFTLKWSTRLLLFWRTFRDHSAQLDRILQYAWKFFSLCANTNKRQIETNHNTAANYSQTPVTCPEESVCFQARWLRSGRCTHMHSVTATYYRTRKIRSGSNISSGFVLMSTGSSRITLFRCT